MNTKEEFMQHMNWSTLAISEKKAEELFDSVDHGYFANMTEVEEDFPTGTYARYEDVDLHSVLEAFGDLYENGEGHHVSLYHVQEYDMYVGVIEY